MYTSAAYNLAALISCWSRAGVYSNAKQARSFALIKMTDIGRVDARPSWSGELRVSNIYTVWVGEGIDMA